ncbi:MULTISPECIES: hypothetical protein [unclassified Luteibacter]|uniref:hypothetical protein n=1 Tax=unclassified Luteibacter TaxID=2620188 RepID=UPI0008B416D3|nr:MULTISPECIES: hypothetical protein [unclassified Luteibacter]MDR6936061.1 hypothetical protein [Luteibacter sp. 3190]SEO54411.1 hypothetical protein SAMN02800692_1065 [Luteibacter sp. UNC138MFCol5.1]SEV89078.1 hypothetical protein SAMN04515660_0695 [Luteibacter sp. 329MFSha]
MTATWKTVYEGEHEKRTLTVLESNDGTYKVLTKQNYYEDGGAYQDGKTFVHVSPSSVGEEVESEANTRDALKEALLKLHFSQDTVSAICDRLH